MTTGAVRWFDVPKGYGLIKPDDGGVDVLVDICAVERAEMASLKQGQRLSFEIVHDERIGRSYAENLIASEIRTPPLNAFDNVTCGHFRPRFLRHRRGSLLYAHCDESIIAGIATASGRNTD
jgi:cold shock protein